MGGVTPIECRSDDDRRVVGMAANKRIRSRTLFGTMGALVSLLRGKAIRVAVPPRLTNSGCDESRQRRTPDGVNSMVGFHTASRPLGEIVHGSILYLTEQGEGAPAGHSGVPGISVRVNTEGRAFSSAFLFVWVSRFLVQVEAGVTWSPVFPPGRVAAFAAPTSLCPCSTRPGCAG